MANFKIKVAIVLINFAIKFIPKDLRTKALINNMMIMGRIDIKE